MKAYYMLFLSVVFASNLYASRKGNGGIAWGCFEKKNSQRIIWIRLADLYEIETDQAKELLSFNNHSVTDIVNFIKHRLNKIDSSLLKNIDPTIKRFLNRDFIARDAELEPTNDLENYLRPSKRSCLEGEIRKIQLVNYINSNRIEVDAFFYDRVLEKNNNRVDKAALIFHEAMYTYFRKKYRHATSSITREIIGALFSTQSNLEIASRMDELLGTILTLSNDMKFSKIKGARAVLGSCAKSDVESGAFNCSKIEEGRNHDINREINNRIETKRIVNVKDFEIQTTEVTQEVFFRVTGKKIETFSDKKDCPSSYKEKISFSSGEIVHYCKDLPFMVESRDYKMIFEFIKTLNEKDLKYDYSLPGENQWEYATRAGTRTTYFFGDDPSQLPIYAVFGSAAPQSIATKQMNPNGLYDIYGNARELVYREHFFYKGTFAMPSIISKGGNYMEGDTSLRSASRGHATGLMGFRLVRELKK